MEREDPLERLERQEQEKKKGNGALKGLMVVLALIALGLACALGYIWKQKSGLVKDLEVEKEDLTEQIIALQKDYEGLSSDYDSINAQLDSSREEIAQLVDRIQNTDATNRAKIRQYEKELGTLRGIMRGYITQIDSLNTLNHKLTLQAAEAKKEVEEVGRQNENLTKQVESLNDQLALGSTIKARGLSLLAYNDKDKLTDRSNKAVRLMVDLTLGANDIAEKGPVRVYVRVKDPEGFLLQDGTGASFTCNGEAMSATASREVDYTGDDVDISIYINNISNFEQGVYTAEVYTTNGLLGTAETLLR